MSQNTAEIQKSSTPPSLADLISGDQPSPSIGREVWITIAMAGAAFLLANFWELPQLVGTWRHDPNWSHGFIIPLFSLYLLYIRRDELVAAKSSISIIGLLILAGSILAQYVSLIILKTHWGSQLAIVSMLFGLVLYLGGWGVIRVTWLPILFLLFSIPMPARVYNQLAMPLQEFAAAGSVAILELFGVNVHLSASHMDVQSISGVWRPLTVAEACSGVRSLMAFLALGVAMAWITNRPVWQRIVMLIATVPVLVGCNVLRVAITSTMFVIDEPQLGEDFMHKFMGMLMMVPAAGILLLLGWLLGNIFERDPSEQDSSAQEAPR